MKSTFTKAALSALASLFLFGGGLVAPASAQCYDDYYDDCEEEEEEEEEYEEPEDNSGSTVVVRVPYNPVATQLHAAVKKANKTENCIKTTCARQVGRWVRKAVSTGAQAGVGATIISGPSTGAKVGAATTVTALVWEIKTVYEPCKKCF